MTRIYPTYWVDCIPLAMAGIAAPDGADRRAQARCGCFAAAGPERGPPLLLVAWTLEFEVYFYLAFALLIWAGLGRRKRIMALVVWGAIVVVARAILAPTRTQAVLDAVLSPLVFEFLAGCAAAWLCAAGVAPGEVGGCGNRRLRDRCYRSGLVRNLVRAALASRGGIRQRRRAAVDRMLR